MNLPDSFYIALCMTVLLVGAVYWVWTQIQFVQRKVNILENIVYELKQMFETQKSPVPSPDLFGGLHAGSSRKEKDEEMRVEAPTSPSRYPPAPPSVVDLDDDLLHESLQNEADAELTFTDGEEPLSIQEVEAPLQLDEPVFRQEEIAPTDIQAETVVAQETQDLQPGGVGSGVVSEVSSLDSMTIKELRRLAAQRGIAGASDMPKKRLIAAIRATPSDAFTFDAHL